VYTYGHIHYLGITRVYMVGIYHLGYTRVYMVGIYTRVYTTLGERDNEAQRVLPPPYKERENEAQRALPSP